MSALEIAPSDADTAASLHRFEALYRREFAFVWAAARHFGVAPGAVDDVVQEVFLVAYRRLEHVRFEVSTRAWLFGVTRRVAFRYRRGAARSARRHAAIAAIARPPAETPQQRLDDAEEIERLLARLSASMREVWQMTELLGMSAPEIASELGIPLNTVYSRLRIAREHLRGLVGDAELSARGERARRRLDPPPQAQQRTWGLIAPGLGQLGSSGAGLVAWVKAQTAMTGTFVAASAAAVVLVVQPDVRGSRAPEAAAAVEAPVALARGDEAPGVFAPSVAPASIAEIPAPPAAELRMSARTGALPAAEAKARLAEEIALIDRAHAQLAAADVTAALATIAAHAFRFPRGVLADVREAAYVDARCRRGDVADAEAAAARLVLEHPASAVAQRFANFRCPR